jgi:hypothetical protein
MSDRLDIGAVESVKIDVLTETGWFDDARFKQDMSTTAAPSRRNTRLPGMRRMLAAMPPC